MQGIRWNTLVRIVVGITQVGLGLLMVWLSRRFIDVTIRTGSNRDVWIMVALLVAVVIGGIALRQLYYYMSTLAMTRQTNLLRLQSFSRLFDRQLFTDREIHSGDVTSRMSKDIDAVGETSTSLIPNAIITLVQLTGAFLLLHSMDRWLAWALLLLTPLVIVFGKLIARPLRQMTLDIREEESRIQMQVQEGMEHNATLRSLGSEQWVTDRLDRAQERLMGRVKRRTRFTVFTRIILASCFGLGYLLCFVWGGLQLRAGAITFGVMTAFLQLVSQIQNPIFTLLNMVPQLIHTTASIDRLEELLQVDSEDWASASLQPVSQGVAGVRVNELVFRYPSSDRPVFNGFSHDFRPGSTTALMGHTGVGKTTLFRLLLSLVKPESGSLTLYDGVQELSVSAKTRPDFVFVPQGNTLMSGTVRFNLQLAKPSATDDELRAVLHTAVADFVFDLPAGLDTELGERGIGLSEGQAQRIAIARALLREGGILILDESTSALDGPTEARLLENISAAYKGRKTLIIISHRPSVLPLADAVLKL